MNSVERITKIFAQIMEVPAGELTLESDRKQLEKWDSLNHLNLVMEIENEFGISVPLNEMAELNSVKDVVELVERHTQS